MLLMLHTPALKKKVAKELGEAQVTIDNKLLPKGPNVVHYTSLPSEGRTAEWISAEMARMDEEMGNHSNWQNGKLSGAVYRMFFSTVVPLQHPILIILPLSHNFAFLSDLFRHHSAILRNTARLIPSAVV